MNSLWLTSILVLLLTPPFRQQPSSDLSTQFNRAVELQQQGKLKEAADEYRTLLKLKPDYAEAHANLGVVLSRLGHYEEAVASYESALRLNPRLIPILLNLGIAHHRAGQFAKAAEALERFLATAPAHVQARQLLGVSLVELGRDADAVPHLEQTLSAAPRDPAVLYSLGRAYLRLRRPGFRATLERLAAFPDGLPALHLLQGQAFLGDQEYEQAVEELQAAAKLNPELPRLQYSLALSYLKLGRHKEAISAFEGELRRQPQDFTTLYYLAYLQEAEGHLPAAQQYLNHALKLDAESAEANALAGKMLFKQGKAAEAVKPLETAVAKKPTDPDPRYLLARVYQQLGRREEAAREFAEVQRLKAEQLKNDRANTPKP